MNILAINASPRKGKSTDNLIDKAIEGAQTQNEEIKANKIHLTDYKIEYCKNCLVCRETKNDAPYAKCVIRDDMDKLYEPILQSDGIIIGSPVHMAYPPAPLMTFLERICWVFAKPERQILTIKGCPMPRSNKKRKLVTIVVSGVVPPLFRKF